MSMRKYKTKQRDTILSVFQSHPTKCFTVKELTDVCEGVGVATVYRTLSVLESEGVIRRFMGNDSVLFRLVSHSEDCHMHMVCRSCGDMLHSECEFISEIKHHLKSEHDFSLDMGATVIYGLCGKCQKGGLS